MSAESCLPYNKVGYPIIIHSNYMLMKDEDDTMEEQFYWLETLAGAISRFIERTLIGNNNEAQSLLAWYCEEVEDLFDPMKLTGKKWNMATEVRS